VDDGLDAEALELAQDVDHAAVAQVGHVLLEGQAENAHPRALDELAPAREELDRLLGHEGAHAVVDPPAREDHLRVVAHLLRLVREVVGIDADAVAADEPRREGEEVPLGARGGEHVLGPQAQAVEDHRQLVHEGDVEIALGVLDHLRGLRGADRGGAVHADGDDRAVDRGHALEGRLVFPGDHLGDALEGVFLVTGIDAFGRVAEEEIPSPPKARNPLEDRPAEILRDAGVDRGLVHHHGARREGGADRLARSARPAVSRARRGGARSGRRWAATGVGTATTKKVAPRSSAGSCVKRSVVARRSSESTSPVASRPSLSAWMRFGLTSKPMVPGNFLARAIATGSPTYPNPITAMRSLMLRLRGAAPYHE